MTNRNLQGGTGAALSFSNTLPPEALSLPVMQVAGKVNDILDGNGSVVVTAPPGAGKSTLLPITILGGDFCSGKVLMLEPRRLAARQVAERMAFLLGGKVGATAGYRIRFESRVSSATRIEVITEGILSRMMLEDPTLDGVSVLIFDEFHERSLFSDEALALARETQRLVRPDLKIVIMSASIDAEGICRELHAPLVESRGRSYDVDLRYAAKDTDPSSCAADTARAILAAHRDNDGDILAFLPGEAEIRRCAELLGDAAGSTRVCPLYGMLPFAEQNRAIAPSGPGERKIVLATPIAETSLTIEGVRVVVDCGLCRSQVYDHRTGQSHLETVRISRDMALQRAGRAGRVAAGVCYRLYSEQSFRTMKETRVPEILEADLVPLSLDLAVWGAGDAASLPWLTPPPSWKLPAARSVLQSLGALDDSGRVTPTGRKLSSFPCHPRLAKMLAEASRSGADAALAADLAALVDDRDPLSSGNPGIDMDLRVAALRQERRRGSASGKWARVIRAAAQYRSIVSASEDNSAADPSAEGRLLAAAFPERVGKSDPSSFGTYLLASGDTVRVDAGDDIAASDWLVAVSANVQPGVTGRVFLAARLDPRDLIPLARVQQRVVWDTREAAVKAAREWRIGSLLVDSRPLDNVPAAAVSGVLCEAARKYGTSMFSFDDEVSGFQRRVAFVSQRHPELGLPDISTGSVLGRASEWLPLYAGKAVSASELRRIDMSAVLRALLDYDMQQAVDRLAPSHVTVPTGSRIRLEYRQGADAPVLKVRLQECFGMSDTPKVDDGRVPVLMELLSPGYKPVQLTSDLASFWSDAYFEVRKELRRRYPKHSWPDNPLEAPAVRGVRRKD